MPNPHADIVSELRKAEFPNTTEYRCLMLKRATGGLDVYVRAMDDTGTQYQACADDCDGEGGWHPAKSACGPSPIGALDALIAKLGFTATDDGRLVRTGKVDATLEGLAA